MGCRPMPNDVLLRSGTKGALILRYDDDGYSAVFSEILQCIRKRAEPRDVEWAVTCLQGPVPLWGCVPGAGGKINW
jgi:hypothetical protein